MTGFATGRYVSPQAVQSNSSAATIPAPSQRTAVIDTSATKSFCPWDFARVSYSNGYLESVPQRAVSIQRSAFSQGLSNDGTSALNNLADAGNGWLSCTQADRMLSADG